MKKIKEFIKKIRETETMGSIVIGVNIFILTLFAVAAYAFGNLILFITGNEAFGRNDSAIIILLIWFVMIVGRVFKYMDDN